MPVSGVLGRLLSSVAAGALIAGGALAQDTVGVTAAVNPQATGTPPQRATRTLNVGLEMFRNERVVTGPEGKTQLQFVDGSALTVGPNSDLVLDEFVYDPATGTGKLAMTATRGVFRLVGGKISKSEPITLKTPTATLGIRGGIVTGEVGTGSDFFGFLFGQQMTVDGTGPDGQPVQQVVTRPGTGVPLSPSGAVLPPTPIPQGKIERQMAVLEGQRGQSGGASEQPTENRVAATNLGNLGSGNPPNNLVAPAVVGLDPVSVLGSVAETVDLSQASQADNITDVMNSQSNPLLLFGTGFTGRYKSTPGNGSGLGAGAADAFFNRPVFGGVVAGNFRGLTIESSLIDASSIDDFLFIAPASGTLLETHPRGSFFSFESAGTQSPFGPIRGVGFAASNNDFVFYASEELNFSNERSVLFAGVPTPRGTLDNMPGSTLLTFDVRADAIFGSNLAFILPQYGGNLQGTRSKAFIRGDSGAAGSQVAFLQGNLAISGQGASQQSAASVLVGRVVNAPGDGNGLLDGQARGTFRVSASGSAGFLTGPVGFASDALGNGVYGSTGPDFFVLEASGGLNPSGSSDFTATSLPNPIGVAPNLGGASSPTYYPNNLALRIDNPAAGARQTATLNGFFAGLLDKFTASGSLISTSNAFGGNATSDLTLNTNAGNNTLSGVMVGEDSFAEASYNLSFGGATGNGRSAYIDNGRLAAVEAGGNSATRNGSPPGAFLFYIVGNGLVSTSNFLPQGISYCDCPASTFGFWGMDFVRATGERDRVHLGQFVAGVIPTVAEVPLSGTATYNGHAIGDVSRGATRYLAAGNFSMNYTFGSGGSWQVNNFDGGSLVASVSPGMPNTATYSGNLTGSFGGDTISGAVNGAFFKGAGNPVGETGSRFDASGTVGGQPYAINGVTQGKQTSFSP